MILNRLVFVVNLALVFVFVFASIRDVAWFDLNRLVSFSSINKLFIEWVDDDNDGDDDDNDDDDDSEFFTVNVFDLSLLLLLLSIKLLFFVILFIFIKGFFNTSFKKLFLQLFENVTRFVILDVVVNVVPTGNFKSLFTGWFFCFDDDLIKLFVGNVKL